MSIPVQVVVSHATLLPAVEEIQGRLGTIGGAQALWVLVGADDPQLPAKAAAQLRAMLATRGHEGGYAQVLLAQDAASLGQLAAQLRLVDVGRAPWGVVGIVLAEEREAAGLAALQLPSLHLVPAALAYRELAWRDRERSAVNLLGLLVDLARLPLAREAFAQWVTTYGGVRVTLAQAARFQAPMVQRVLARRLASRVADRMVESLQLGRSASAAPKLSDPPEPPQQDVESALRERARDLGDKIAARIVGEGDLPDEETVQRRARLETRELPARLEDVLRRHGSDLRELALAWQEGLRRWVDDGLERGNFSALIGLIDKLQAWRERLGVRVYSAADHGPRRALNLDPPDSAQVRQAVRSLQLARAMHDDSHLLFGGWTLGLSSAIALSTWAGLGAAGNWRPLAAGGVGMGCAAVGATVSAVRSNLAKRELQRLMQAEQAARDTYRQAWSRLIERQIADIGQVLHERMVRFADEVVATELAWLQAVHDTILDVHQQHKKPERARLGADTGFESDIRLPESFYAKAEQGADPAQIFDEYEHRLAQPSWRQQLEFMNSEALIKRCAGLYAAFREQIPFAQREELREVALPATRQAIAAMFERLGEYLPAELHAERLAVVPQRLQDAVPADGVGHLRIHFGVSDAFAAISRPVESALGGGLR